MYIQHIHRGRLNGKTTKLIAIAFNKMIERKNVGFACINSANVENVRNKLTQMYQYSFSAPCNIKIINVGCQDFIGQTFDVLLIDNVEFISESRLYGDILPTLSHSRDSAELYMSYTEHPFFSLPKNEDSIMEKWAKSKGISWEEFVRRQQEKGKWPTVKLESNYDILL